MDNKVDLIKDIFNKDQYLKAIDTEFKELGIKPIVEELEDQISIEEFFELYNELFYEIPQTGESNSHEYLIKTSSEYINFEQTIEEIEALRAEISQLRKNLLEEQIKNSKLELNE